MTKEEAKQLKANDRVRWSPSGWLGWVHEVTPYAVQIEWDDGEWSLFLFDDAIAPWSYLELAVTQSQTA